MTINEIQDEIIEEFDGFDDWMDKYQLLIDLGNEQEPLDEQYKIESNLIDGCQSRVWLQADYEDGLLFFRAESDALIVKGIVTLLIRVLSGHTPQEIVDISLTASDSRSTSRPPAQTVCWRWLSRCAPTDWCTHPIYGDNTRENPSTDSRVPCCCRAEAAGLPSR